VAITRTNGLSIFAMLGVAGLILTGCSSSDDGSDGGGASASNQSVEEACSVLIEGVSDMQTELTENADTLQSDPTAAAAAYEEVVALFQENADKVTNEDVKPIADEVEEVFVTFGDTIDAAATDPESVDPQAVTDYTTDLQEATTELDEVCGA
jgi:PBP1b-binding outer membrane lipoprotein LpoB